MILSAAAFLTGLGIVIWVIGTALQLGFQYSEAVGIAIIGGSIILLVGVMIMVGGLDYRTGETVDQTANATIENVSDTTTLETRNVSGETTYIYESVPVHERFPLGLITTLLGALLTIGPMRHAGGLR